MAAMITKEMTVRKDRLFLFSPDFYIPIVVLAVTTLVLNLFDWDIALQRAFYTGNRHWSYGNIPLFRLLYRYASFPGLILALAGLFIFISGFTKRRIRSIQRVGLYLVLVMAIGPGILVNSMLKDRWGRPRPRDIVEFGGKHAYEAPLRVDSQSPGKSFPSGHAAAGFYFYVLYFVLRAKKPRLAIAALIFATLYGMLIGLARMAQGGHFCSDIIWAGGLVYLCAAVIYHIMGKDDGLYRTGGKAIAMISLPTVYQMGLYAFGVLVAALIFLATPFYRQHEYNWNNELAAHKLHSLLFDAASLDLRIRTGTSSTLRTDTNGFGFPGSKITFDSTVTQKDSGGDVSISQIKRGLFTELNCLANLELDSLRVNRIKAHVKKGDISLSISDLGKLESFMLETGTGDIMLTLPDAFADTLRIDGFPKITNNRKDIATVYGKPIAGKPWQVKINKGSLVIK